MTYNALTGGECVLFCADTQPISKDTWWKSEYGRTRALGELVRCGEYFS